MVTRRCFNTQELEDWIKRAQKVNTNLEFYCEPKFDGASLNLFMKNGLLKQISQEEMEVLGEDVTNNVKNNPLYSTSNKKRTF